MALRAMSHTRLVNRLGCHENSDLRPPNVKTQTPKTQIPKTQIPKTQTPRFFFKKGFTLLTRRNPYLMITQCSCMKATARKKQDIYLLRFIAVGSIKQWKTNKILNSSWHFDGICWRIFYRRNRRHRVANVGQIELLYARVSGKLRPRNFRPRKPRPRNFRPLEKWLKL